MRAAAEWTGGGLHLVAGVGFADALVAAVGTEADPDPVGPERGGVAGPPVEGVHAGDLHRGRAGEEGGEEGGKEAAAGHGWSPERNSTNGLKHWGHFSARSS